MRIESALYDTAIRVTPPLASPVSGEHISLGNDVIGVHIHTKDAYAREEFEANNIRALRHRTSELTPLLASPVSARGVRRGGHRGARAPPKISVPPSRCPPPNVPPSSVHPLACAPFPCPNR